MDGLFEAMVVQARDAMFAVRLDGRILYANAAAERMYGYTLAELGHLSVEDLIAETERDAVFRRLQESSEAGPCYRTIHRRKDGMLFPVEISSQRRTIHGETELIGIVRDRTQIVGLESEIEQQKEQIQRQKQELMKAHSELLKAKADKFSLIQAIPATLLRIRPDGSLGERWISEQDSVVFSNSDWRHIKDVFSGEVVESISVAVKRASELNQVQVVEFCVNAPAGKVHYEARLTTVGTDEVVMILRNNTVHKKMHEQLMHNNIRDSLTKLHNRRFFEDRLAIATTVGGSDIGIIICDIDGLKTVNDTLGHVAGDRVLETVASILNKISPPKATIARIGGDEFAVMFSETSLQEMEKLCDALKQQIDTHNADFPSLPISVSTGLSVQRGCAF